MLWGSGFEETPANIFVSELRSAGLHVSVVGLNMQRLTGAHGVPLQPDMTLEQALPQAHLARVVIIPCQPKYLMQFNYDPRITGFFQRLKGNQTLVVGEVGLYESEAVRAMLPPDVTVLEYVIDEGLAGIPAVIQQAIAACMPLEK
jgi:hypothetical protein